MKDENFELAQTRKWGECVSDEKLLWLAFLTLLNNFTWFLSYLLDNNIKYTSNSWFVLFQFHSLKSLYILIVTRRFLRLFLNHDFSWGAQRSVARKVWIIPILEPLSLPWYPWVSSKKKFIQFGPAVWPA